MAAWLRNVVLGILLGALGGHGLGSVRGARANDSGQWGAFDPGIASWYRNLKMPDAPAISCCGEADSYWADSFEVSKDGLYVAIITDDRPDAPMHRPHREIGERIVIPNHKLNKDSNPTGHGILFVGATGVVYCYLPPGGV